MFAIILIHFHGSLAKERHHRNLAGPSTSST
jgi:hypothetical protein